ncbi:DC-STAMP domain-containing protein 2 [Condylostylus longicornis]|uniref:DC-STAMP domain-containing protein 2 n=1 Tax=Condylostylus longicornis TaxID=2530218 RepID=UPI00244DF436|nr:DC-STAMP domain-containing protein 2 [Condylostylus longicornis]
MIQNNNVPESCKAQMRNILATSFDNFNTANQLQMGKWNNIMQCNKEIVVNVKVMLQKMSNASLFYAFLGIFITVCLTFSKSLRCHLVLMIPIICSVKGRSFLVAYALVLTATGPGLIITKNIEILSKSLTCGQEQLKEALKEILDIVKSPLIAIKNSVKIALGELEKVLKKIELVFKEIVKLLKEILNTIKQGFSWLTSRSMICDKELGNPFERCIKISNDTINECEIAMESIKSVCQVAQVFTGLCYSLKLFDVFCQFQDFISDTIILQVTERMKKFQNDLHNIFDASIKFDHDFYFVTNHSKNWSEIGNDIKDDIHGELKNFFVIFGWAEFLAGFMFLRLIFKSMYYKHKYMTSNQFDNYFITKEFVDIDNQRKSMRKELALPLTKKEERRYVKISSMTFVKSEILKIGRSVIFLIITTTQIFCTCLIDYSLYSILNMMRQIGLTEEPLQAPSFFGVEVSGVGFLADIYNGVINSFEPLAAKYEMDPTPCLPIPQPLNFKRYYQIGAVLIVCWIFLFMEPYALRFRQIIMKIFYPERAKERAVWLYNEILLKRSCFIKIARRQARSKILKNGEGMEFSCMDWIRAKTNQWYIFRKIFGEGKNLYCVLCASFLTDQNAVKCETPQCKGVYCSECYRESENICCLCKSPIEYGDASDVSEELDSDDLGEIKLQELKVKQDGNETKSNNEYF